MYLIHEQHVAVAESGELKALCHLGVNVVPSGHGCGVFARDASRAAPRMVIGEARAVSELWDAAHERLPRPREDRPGQPVFVIRTPPEPGGTALRPATLDEKKLGQAFVNTSHSLQEGMADLLWALIVSPEFQFVH